jgi:hypothetical protein
MTVHGMQQHEQSSVLKHWHLGPWGLTMEPAAVEIEDVVEAGILCGCRVRERCEIRGFRRGALTRKCWWMA